VRVLSIVHDADAGAGVFADAVAERGHELDEWDISRRPEPPAPIHEYAAVLVFGGPMHVDQEERHGWLRDEHRLLQQLLADEVPLSAGSFSPRLSTPASVACRAPRSAGSRSS